MRFLPVVASVVLVTACVACGESAIDDASQGGAMFDAGARSDVPDEGSVLDSGTSSDRDTADQPLPDSYSSHLSLIFALPDATLP